MEALHASATISDNMLMMSVEKEYLEKRIKSDLAHSLAKAIMDDKRFNKIIVRREERMPWQIPGETIYDAEVVVLTHEEAKEFKELRKFKEMLQKVSR